MKQVLYISFFLPLLTAAVRKTEERQFTYLHVETNDNQLLDMQCADVDDKDSLLFFNPSDCSSFYQCSNGVAYLHHCPTGLYFNRRLNVCSHPRDARCQVFRKLPVFICPAEDPDTPVYFPDNNDCSNFYQCSHGVAYLHECPPKLYFDKDKNVCVHPSETTCFIKTRTGRGHGNIIKASTFLHFVCPQNNKRYPEFFSFPSQCPLSNKHNQDTTALISCTFGLQADKSNSFMDGLKKANCKVLDVNAMCQASSGYNSVNLPHPFYCKFFFRCRRGVAYLHSCPKGLYFDPHLNTCNYPYDTNCSVKLPLKYKYVSL